MITLIRRFALGLVTFALALGAATAQTSRESGPTQHPFLWRVDGKGDEPAKVPCYLFGTMHLGDARIVAIPPVVEKARENADAVYCELALDMVAKHQLKLTKMMLLPKGDKLSKLLPKDVYEMLAKKLDSLGMPAKRMDGFQVWAVGILLAQLEASKLGMLKSLDSKLYMDAKRDDKEVGGLEDIDEQMRALSSGTREEQIARLRESLRHMAKLDAKGESALAKLLEVYLTGDEVKMLDYVEESMGDDDELNDKFMRPMLDHRNVHMADRIAGMLAENPRKKYFFAIGAMHYVGDTGLPTLLRKKGYRITRLAAPTAAWKDVVAMRVELSNLRKEIRQLKKKVEAGKK